jgi:hypothetical protein
MLLHTHHFLSVWKHGRVISIHNPGKDPALTSSYRPISLLDTIDYLFEKILLAKFLHELSERGLMRDEQLGFRPRPSTSLHLARIVERITRNFGEKRLTRSLPRRGQSLRYQLDRWPPLQAYAPQLPILHSPYYSPLPLWSDVQSVLPDGTRQIFKLTEGCPRRPKRKPKAAEDSRHVEAIVCDGQVD